MKLIFLDFDGVLNSAAYFDVFRETFGFYPTLASPGSFIDPNAVERLNRLLEETGASVIISSSWRHLADFRSLADDLLRPRGLKLPERVVGQTPRGSEVGGPRCRGGDIHAFLQHQLNEQFDYVVIDDDSDRGPIPEERWIRTSVADGLQDEHVERAIEILNRG